MSIKTETGVAWFAREADTNREGMGVTEREAVHDLIGQMVGENWTLDDLLSLRRRASAGLEVCKDEILQELLVGLEAMIALHQHPQ